MKKVLFLLGILALFSVIFVAVKSRPQSIISNTIKGKDIKTRNLVYRIYLAGVIPAGEGMFMRPREEMFDGQRVYHLQAMAQSQGLFSRLFNASATFDSYVDRERLIPLFFRQRLSSPGKEKAEKEIFYDQKAGVMTVGGTKRQILPSTYEPLSLMLKFMRMDFEKISRFKVNINAHKKNYIFEATVKPKDISLKGNAYRIFLLQGDIKRVEKNLYHQTKITAVFLKDKENIPLLIKVFSSGVSIHARLVKIRS